MRHGTQFILWLLVAGFAVGCLSRDDKTTPKSNPPEAASVQRDKVRTESREAAQAARDYAYAERNEFVSAMNRELAEIEAEMERLKAKADRASGEIKDDAKARLDAVREKWDQAKNQLDQAEDATESTWDDVKGGFWKLNGELKESFNQTRQWVSDKIAP